ACGSIIPSGCASRSILASPPLAPVALAPVALASVALASVSLASVTMFLAWLAFRGELALWGRFHRRGGLPRGCPRVSSRRRSRGRSRGSLAGRRRRSVAEHGLQISSRPGHPALDRADGAAADRRRLLIFETIRPHQDQRLALLGRQLGEGAAEIVEF